MPLYVAIRTSSSKVELREAAADELRKQQQRRMFTETLGLTNVASCLA